jgi:hypothetical protein
MACIQVMMGAPMVHAPMVRVVALGVWAGFTL